MYDGLFALQHRGQESAGIVLTSGPEAAFAVHKGMGLVSQVFSPETLERLSGTRKPSATLDIRPPDRARSKTPNRSWWTQAGARWRSSTMEIWPTPPNSARNSRLRARFFRPRSRAKSSCIFSRSPGVPGECFPRCGALRERSPSCSWGSGHLWLPRPLPISSAVHRSEGRRLCPLVGELRAEPHRGRDASARSSPARS